MRAGPVCKPRKRKVKKTHSISHSSEVAEATQSSRDSFVRGTVSHGGTEPDSPQSIRRLALFRPVTTCSSRSPSCSGFTCPQAGLSRQAFPQCSYPSPHLFGECKPPLFILVLSSCHHFIRHLGCHLHPRSSCSDSRDRLSAPSSSLGCNSEEEDRAS